MANTNTIVDALREAGLPQETPLVLSNPGGNNPWLFTLPATSVSNAGAPCVLEVPSTTANGVTLPGLLSGVGSAVPDQAQWNADRNMFLVRAVGRVQPNATAKTLKLYVFAGNGIPTGSAGALQDFEIGLVSATLPTAPTGGAFSNWFIEVRCLWDSASLQLTGSYKGSINGTLVAETGFVVYNPSAWAAQQAAGAYNNLPFVIGANIASTANANPDLVYLDEFTAEIL